MRKPLRHGYTTGACAAAAAKGAALLLRNQAPVGTVTIELPAGFPATFPLHGQRWDGVTAACCVIKDAGDDPDVTHGCEVWAEVALLSPSPRPSPPEGEGRGEGEGDDRIEIRGGAGIGRVTKPGLAVAVGEWAINPVPRRMIEAALREVFADGDVAVTLSIPDGAERARRTLNERLGILGGLSILGTTGVVKPISTQAWTDTLDATLDVAKACGCSSVVLATGRTSEVVAQRFFSPPPSMGGGWGEGDASGSTPTPPAFGHPPLVKGGLGGVPEEAFIMMGDHVGYALRAVGARGFTEVVLAGQFAKLLKIACGHEQTHVASSELDLRTLADWLRAEPSLAPLAERAAVANTAREVLERSGHDPALLALVAARARAVAATLAPAATVKVLLAGYDGQVLYFR